MLGVFGPSGTGKSVLLKTTIGLIPLDRGDVRVEGESAYHGGRKALQRIRKKVGYVFQYAALFDSLSVYENVEMGIPEDELETALRKRDHSTDMGGVGSLELGSPGRPEQTSRPAFWWNEEAGGDCARSSGTATGFFFGMNRLRAWIP